MLTYMIINLNAAAMAKTFKTPTLAARAIVKHESAKDFENHLARYLAPISNIHNARAFIVYIKDYKAGTDLIEKAAQGGEGNYEEITELFRDYVDPKKGPQSVHRALKKETPSRRVKGAATTPQRPTSQTPGSMTRRIASPTFTPRTRGAKTLKERYETIFSKLENSRGVITEEDRLELSNSSRAYYDSLFDQARISQNAAYEDHESDNHDEAKQHIAIAEEHLKTAAEKQKRHGELMLAQLDFLETHYREFGDDLAKTIEEAKFYLDNARDLFYGAYGAEMSLQLMYRKEKELYNSHGDADNSHKYAELERLALDKSMRAQILYSDTMSRDIQIEDTGE